jgi:hypothetical protein
MASRKRVTISSRKFNWADDEDDKFDLDSWNATADTSAPTAAELGPLQVLPTENEAKEDKAFTLERIRNERAYCNPPISQESSNAEPVQEPEPFAQPPAEVQHLTVVDCSPEHQVMCARHVNITHAIGGDYDGKEESEPPAYPELSYDPTQRSGYTKQFQNWKLKHRGLSSTKVYRSSPLNIVTSIDEAHNIDDVVDGEGGEVAKADREMNEEIDRMIDDQITNHIDQFQWFSRRELEDFYHQFKAQQQQPETGDDVSDGEDSDSGDGWDEEAYEPYSFSAKGDEASFPVTDPAENGEMSSTTRAVAAADDEEELDFNDVVFGEDFEDEEFELPDETDSEPSDEGYVSSSPPDTPFSEAFNKMDTKDTQSISSATDMRLSTSSRRRQTICRTDSMDALKAFRQTAKYEQCVDDAFQDEEDVEVSGSLQEDISPDALKTSLKADDNPAFFLAVTPPEDEQQTQNYFAQHTTLLSSPKATAVDLIEENDQVIHMQDESRGILDLTFVFPVLSIATASPATEDTVTVDTSASTSKPSSRRWTDPPKYDPSSPSNATPPKPLHTKHNSISLEYLAAAMSTSWLYMGQVPWRQVGIMTAGVVAGGLLSMARHV